MAEDGGLDPAGMSREELIEALRSVDRGGSPEDHARLVEELERRAAAESARTASATTEHRFAFHGDGKEYFRIWIVNLALTIVTIGIYSAWAAVRKRRYFYGNTELAGASFGYHGDPRRILRGRLIAAGLGILYFGATRISPVTGGIAGLLLFAATPWLIVKSRIFALRMTSWRGMRFAFREDYRGAYKALFLWILLAGLTVGVLFPRAIRERYRFIVSRSCYGASEFECEPPVGRFYKTFLAAIGLLLLTLIAIGVLGVIGALVWKTGNADGSAVSRANPMVFMVVGLLPYIVLFPVIGGYVQSRNLNAVLGATTIGPHRLVSRMLARDLALLYFTNILLLIVTLGLYAPWAEIRMARYRLGMIGLEQRGPFEELRGTAEGADPSATAEEVSSLFDVDFGL